MARIWINNKVEPNLANNVDYWRACQHFGEYAALGIELMTFITRQ